MSDNTYILWGVKFSSEEWGPLVGNFLIMTGIALTLYIALFFGHDDAPGATAPSRAANSPPSSRKRAGSEVKQEPVTSAPTPKIKTAFKPKAEPTTPKSTKKAAATESKSRSTTPAKARSATPSKKAAAPAAEAKSRSTTPAKRSTTPAKRGTKSDLGSLASPEGRRSSRVRSKTPAKDD